jgi:hypothetical protein
MFRSQYRYRRVEIGKSLAEGRYPFLRQSGLLSDFFAAFPQG